ncbi:hypothetical protein [Vibrio renipiscarius]|uniref:Uncharacterized protein n=1 Tax=Vibrio renipiscarius TaxID=1461322 RepID=A0A0C2P103_9VIBR|nr:hypothetical protein [Vibrio renipiscarius]KII75525.1 hypothetical protein PL18_17495 [Vibrio renipiscarius]KII82025.1 hypothetical protein OJ16_02240 [Vibrio renipiscarius]
MINDERIIETLDELDAFLLTAESGVLGLQNVAGVALATHNGSGRRFVAILDDQNQLLLGRWVSEDVFKNGQDLVRNGSKRSR